MYIGAVLWQIRATVINCTAFNMLSAVGDRDELSTFWDLNVNGEAHSEIFRWRYTDRWFAIEGHPVNFDVVSRSKLATVLVSFQIPVKYLLMICLDDNTPFVDALLMTNRNQVL